MPSKNRGRSRAPEKKPAMKAAAPLVPSMAEQLATIEGLLRSAATERASMAVRHAFAVDSVGRSVDALAAQQRLANQSVNYSYSGAARGLSLTGMDFDAAAAACGVVEDRGLWRRVKEWTTGRPGAAARTP